tara:strand:+ start:1447 stop:1578 length:132 start_codon:yes stop_codon:yes gene_type:complete
MKEMVCKRFSGTEWQIGKKPWSSKISPVLTKTPEKLHLFRVLD